jgi:flagellar motor switch protein FliN/FliY
MEFQNKYFIDDDVIVAVSFDLFIEGRVQSQFINVMPVILAREIISNFLKGAENVVDAETKNEKKSDPKQNIEYYDEEEDIEDNRSNTNTKTTARKAEHKVIKQKRKEQAPVNVKSIELDAFEGEEELFSEEQLSNLGLIMSVPLEINVEIGKSKRQIKDILEFTQGTIIELDKQAGALVKLL